MPDTLTAQCQFRKGDQFSSGTATLDRERLRFRGYFQFEIPLADIRSVQVLRDVLKLEAPDGYFTLKLGRQAHLWGDFIQANR